MGYGRKKSKSGQPTVGIVWVIQLQGVFGQQQRAIGVKHHRHLVGPFRVHTLDNRSRVGAVWNPAGMQCHATQSNTAARSKLAVNIKQHFIRFDITMHVRHFDRLG